MSFHLRNRVWTWVNLNHCPIATHRSCAYLAFPPDYDPANRPFWAMPSQHPKNWSMVLLLLVIADHGRSNINQPLRWTEGGASWGTQPPWSATRSRWNVTWATMIWLGEWWWWTASLSILSFTIRHDFTGIDHSASLPPFSIINHHSMNLHLRPSVDHQLDQLSNQS